MPITLPPANIATLDLPLQGIAGPLYRIHGAANNPLFFGRTGGNRFDDPRKSFGVLYAGLSSEAAFAETFLRDPPKQVISEMEIARRRIAQIKPRTRLYLVRAYDEGLAKIGITAEIGTCGYDISQAWAAAFFANRGNFDGIIWRGRHDNGTFSVALFDRARSKLGATIKSREISKRQLKSFSDRWGFGLIP